MGQGRAPAGVMQASCLLLDRRKESQSIFINTSILLTNNLEEDGAKDAIAQVFYHILKEDSSH